MRSADLLARGALLAMLSASAGCASIREPLAKPKDAAAPAAPSTSASAAVGTPSAPATASAPPEPETPIGPEVQRAFDDARRAMLAGRHDEAEKGFRALAQAQPELAGPHANLGILYRHSGKLGEAVAELELAAKANPRRAGIFNELGVTYRQRGQF